METTDYDVGRARVQEEEVETCRPSFFKTMPVGGAGLLILAPCRLIGRPDIFNKSSVLRNAHQLFVLIHYNPHDRALLLCFHGNTVQMCLAWSDCWRNCKPEGI